MELEPGSLEVLYFVDLAVSGRSQGIFLLKDRAYREALLFEAAISLPVGEEAAAN
jgi:hypothetical protein